MWKLVNFAVLLCCCSRRVSTSSCYSDSCKAMTNLAPTAGFQCVLTPLQKGEDCANYSFDGYSRYPADTDSAKFDLRAYVHVDQPAKYIVTAFNLSVSDANFRGLVTRYQNLFDKSESACRYIRLYGNETNPAPRELYVSCPSFPNSYESKYYQLDYLVMGEKRNYSKRYIFKVPLHRYLGDGVSLKEFEPFVYIDVSYAPIHTLHIQPLPKGYNVSKYKIWLINNDTKFVEVYDVASGQNFQYNFSANAAGVYYFEVAAVHEECGDYGCKNNTMPFICILEPPHRLLIMIISTAWIPPVIVYLLYHLYRLYRKDALKRRKMPQCLLVYSPTRLTHKNVMIELAKYLRVCKVNAIMDMLDCVEDTMGKDAECWCDSAFRNADVVLIVSSPPPRMPAESSIVYRNTANYLLNLVEENQSQRGKRFYAVQLPYCALDDVPEQSRHLRRISLPKELPELVKVIHETKRGKCAYSASDKEFLDSVELAKGDVSGEDSSIAKDDRETANLLKAKSRGVASQSYTTDIDELNLLGDSGRMKEEACPRKCLRNVSYTFHVDELNL